MEIIPLPAGEDNYMYLIVDPQAVAVVDPLDADLVAPELLQRHRALDFILITHHHADHILGVEALKSSTGACVIAGEDPRIPAVDRGVGEGDQFDVGAAQVEVLATPGHGDRDLSYRVRVPGQPDSLFCGDALFVSGCGRILEGSAAALWQTLQMFKALPDDTRVFCGHEYTEENLLFACQVEPAHLEYRERLRAIQELRRDGLATVPSTIGIEKQFNPFLRCSNFEDFVDLRQRKDRF